MRMILTVYILIIIYFLIGAVGFYFINRRRESEEAHKCWMKTLVYFVIINIVSLSIVINTTVFRILAMLIILVGFYEIFKLFRYSGYRHKGLFLNSIVLFSIFSSGFFLFSGMKKELIFYSFAIISIFDSFSTITGQLWGRKRILPKISPNKTVAGFIGGLGIAILSGVLIKGLIAENLSKALFLAAGIAVFAFVGDTLTSFYKRKYDVKDFSDLIPGHGGFLDRFDSLVAGGAWIAFCFLLRLF